MVVHRPADHAAAERVDHDRDIQPSFAGPLLGDVGNPEPIRRVRPEVAFHQIGRRHRTEVAACESPSSTAVHALDPGLAHEPGDPFAAAADVVIEPQLDVHAWCAIGAS